MSETVITNVRIRIADEPSGGLIGWASCVLNGDFFLDSIAIHQTPKGIGLTFPSTKSKRGMEYHFYKPISQSAYEKLREAITSRLTSIEKDLS